MEDQQKVIYYCYLIASVSFFISAAINFFSNDTSSMTVIHLSLGATFLCLASSHRKGKDKE